MIESEHLKRTGQALDLSEEYVGFFHLYEQVIAMAPDYFTTLAIRQAGQPDANGNRKGKLGTKLKNVLNGLMINLFFHPSEGAPDLMLVMNLIDKYGIVPESAFSYKIKGDSAEEGVEARVLSFINDVLRNPQRNAEFREKNADGTLSDRPDAERILQELMKVYTLDSATQVAALQTAIGGFDYQGTRYTPQQFTKSVLQFNSAAYEQVVVGPENQDQVMARIRASVEHGDSAQIGIILFDGFREAVKGNGILAPETCGTYKDCKPVGGHAILVVNRTLDTNNQLSGIIIKNSWAEIGLDSSGRTAGPKGYQIITPDYLSELFKFKDREGKSPTWFVILKR